MLLLIHFVDNDLIFTYVKFNFVTPMVRGTGYSSTGVLEWFLCLKALHNVYVTATHMRVVYAHATRLLRSAYKTIIQYVLDIYLKKRINNTLC